MIYLFTKNVFSNVLDGHRRENQIHIETAGEKYEIGFLGIL